MSRQIFSLKHKPGGMDHDQREHGNWSSGMSGGDSLYQTTNQPISPQLNPIFAVNQPLQSRFWNKPTTFGRFSVYLDKEARQIRDNALSQKNSNSYNTQQNPATQIFNRENPDIPKIRNNNGIYDWRISPQTTQGLLDSEDTWFAYDGYILPIVANDISNALAMSGLPSVTHIPQSNTVIVSDFSMPNSIAKDKLELTDDFSSSSLYEQALIDIIMGQGNSSPENYSVLNISNSKNPYDKPTLNNAKPKNRAGFFLRENPEKIRAISYENSGKRQIESLPLQLLREQKNSFTDIKGNIRFSDELLQRLEIAKENIEWSPEVPLGVREQIIQRIDSILEQSKKNLNKKEPRDGVYRNRLDPVLYDAHNSYVDLDDLNQLSYNFKNNPVTPGLVRLKQVREQLKPVLTNAEFLKNQRQSLFSFLNKEIMEQEYPGLSNQIEQLLDQTTTMIMDINWATRGMANSLANPDYNTGFNIEPTQENLNELKRRMDYANDYMNRLDSVIGLSYSNAYSQEKISEIESNLKQKKHLIPIQQYQAMTEQLNNIKHLNTQKSNQVSHMLQIVSQYLMEPQYLSELNNLVNMTAYIFNNIDELNKGISQI